MCGAGNHMQTILMIVFTANIAFLPPAMGHYYAPAGRESLRSMISKFQNHRESKAAMIKLITARARHLQLADAPIAEGCW